MSESVAWTKVTHDGTVYVVSTILRESSASRAPGKYFETLVATSEAYDNRRPWIALQETPGGVAGHCRIVERISREGVEWLKEDDA